MNRFILVLVLILGFVSLINSQNIYDRPSAKYKTIKDRVGEIYVDQGDVSAYLNSQLNVAQKEGDIRLEAGILQLSSDYYLESNVDTAMELSLITIDLLEKAGITDYDLLYKANTHIANAHGILGDNEEALQYYLIALPLAQRCKDKNAIADVNYNISITYSSLGNTFLAIQYMEAVLELDMVNKDSANVASDYLSIGKMYEAIGESEKGLGYLINGLSYVDSIRYPSRYIEHISSLAMMAAHLGRKDMAQQYMELTKSNVGLIQSDRMVSDIHYKMGYIHYQIGEYPQATNEINRCIQKAKKGNYTQIENKASLIKARLLNDKEQKERLLRSIKDKDGLSEVLLEKVTQELITAYRASGKSQELIALSTKYIDDLKAERNHLLSNAYKSMDTQIGLIEKSRELELSEYKASIQKKRAENQLIAIILLSLLLIIITYLSYRNWSQKNIIKHQNIVLQKNVQEKEILFKEIHHRVKNNLQVISSLLYLQAYKSKNPTTIRALKEGRNRVKSMALIHQNLYSKDHVTGVQLEEYIGELAHDLVQNYNNLNRAVDLELEIAPILLDVETLVPLGLVINELISNALKHAFDNDHISPKISIQIVEVQTALSIKISDNGKGMNGQFNQEGSNSFGAELVFSFVQKLQGKIDIQDDNGAHIDILIPKYKKAA